MKHIIIGMSIILLLLAAGCASEKPKDKEEYTGTVSSFKECAKLYPIMESYPRQCRTPDGKTFVEDIEITESESKMALEEARAIAENSECAEKGDLTENYMYNENSQTWWIDIEMRPEFEQEFCNPACVVSEADKTAEINWRCTGALPPE